MANLTGNYHEDLSDMLERQEYDADTIRDQQSEIKMLKAKLEKLTGILRLIFAEVEAGVKTERVNK